MAICGTCGSETARVISTLRDKVFKDDCPNCNPALFAEKFIAPSDKKLWMGWEVNDKHYKKTDDGYQASDSVLQDLQDAVQREDQDDKAKYQAALEKRRQYAALHRKNETPEEAERNAQKTRELVRQWEAEASLEAIGVVLPEENS